MKLSEISLAAAALLSVTFVSCKKDMNGIEPLAAERSVHAGAVMASWSLNNWMTTLPDYYSLSRISVPGTHDSGARNEPFPGTAKTQTLSIADQLNGGIRFLDVRCRHIGNAFAIHHGSIYQNLNFDDVLNACNAFLNSNPGETILMSVKEEYDPTDNTRSFEATFDAYVAKNPSRWYLGETIPTLGNVRGKIVLVRRFGATAAKGINVTNWADNATFSVNNGNAKLRIQDQYKADDNNAKWNTINGLLTEAKTGDTTVMYVNFSSGYKSMIFGIPSITTVSDFINHKLDSYFTDAAKGRFGVIPMDFATADRAKKIVSSNF
ncbi:MAG TPA: phosphatidylinositol-specific phospholipase C [Chitinophaga sp.]|uniref:phosphatidylinositol-specific phospholipase C n=1 Tax=Chitinophaga sp. TaxID=1869181 RepID=UPI002C292A33|nr:phosphatidylinositol-specific phospholipase C [Chitinophaga sp.]HVI45170.1 phosphatidylinositol-specific phospholipase C [Chitinophaga sp.]